MNLKLPHYRTIVLAAALTACAAEEAVRRGLSDTETAVEERDRGRINDMISESCLGARGNGRQEIEERLRVCDAKGFVTRVTIGPGLDSQPARFRLPGVNRRYCSISPQDGHKRPDPVEKS